MRRLALPLLALLAVGAGWLDPHATAREASRLYAAGKFADAAAKYRDALVDDPDSPLLHFNLGNAAYRDGKYDEAARAFADVAGAATDPAHTARAAYNLGNTKYREGAAAETSNPQQALASWAEALVAYRRALGADAADADAKFNYELVSKRIADLQKKLEERKKRDEQRKQQQENEDQQQQRQGQPQPDQQQAEQPQGGSEQGDRQDSPERHAEQPNASGEPKQDAERRAQQDADAKQAPDAGEQKGASPQTGSPGADEPERRDGQGAGTATGEPTEMSPREAQALLDAQRDQEVRPGEIVRQLQGVDVAEPREDW